MRRMKLAISLPLTIILAVLVPASIVGVLGYFTSRSSLRAVEMDANMRSVSGYAAAVDFYVNQARSILEITAHQEEVTEFRSTESHQSLHDLAQAVLNDSNVFEHLTLVNPDGSINMIEPHELENQLSRRDVAFTSWYRQLISSGDTVVSQLGICVATQRPEIIIATPIRSPEGQLTGIWSGGLRLDELSQVGLSVLQTSPLQRYGYITDSRGLIIAHQANSTYVQEQTDFSIDPPVRAALAGQEGTMQYVSPTDGQEKLGAYMPLSKEGWVAVYVVPTAVAFEPVVRNVMNIVLIIGIATIVLVSIGLFIVRQVVRPLGQLTTAAARMGGGDLSQRVKVTTSDELGQLGIEFNRMAESLAEKEAQLREHIGLLETANRELDAFSYSVSHDLRAPLRGIDGFSRILLESYPDKLDEKGKHYLTRLSSAAQRMGELIDNILELSRVTRSDMKYETVDLSALARTIAAELHNTHPERKVEFAITEGLTVNGDATLLRIVLQNFLDNAWKFTSKHSQARIEFGITEYEGKPAYYVRDDGVGFDMNYVSKLFTPFQRLHSIDEFPGNGVGLATVQRIIHRHGGKIWAEGKLEIGATFYFTLGENS